VDESKKTTYEEARAWCRMVATIHADAADLGYSPSQAMQRVREKLADDEREEAQRVAD
jgi:hypothetical protein